MSSTTLGLGEPGLILSRPLSEIAYLFLGHPAVATQKIPWKSRKSNVAFQKLQKRNTKFIHFFQGLLGGHTAWQFSEQSEPMPTQAKQDAGSQCDS